MGRVIIPQPAAPPVLAGVPPRPDRPERAPLPPEIKALMSKFETAREAYLSEQRELLKQLKGATEQDREKVREQIRTKREEWLEQTKRVHLELRERIEELKRDMANREEILRQARPQPGTRPGLQ